VPVSSQPVVGNSDGRIHAANHPVTRFEIRRASADRSSRGSGPLLLYAAGVPYNAPVAAGQVVAGLSYNQPQPRIRWVGDELYLLLGRAALRVAY